MSAPPSNVVDGPRKRRPTERVTENGDPLVQKKAKTMTFGPQKVISANTKTTSTQTTKATLSRRASIEDAVEPTPAPGPQPRHPARILEAADDSDGGHNDFDIDMPELIDIEDDDEEADEDDEDDEAELGRFHNCQTFG